MIAVYKLLNASADKSMQLYECTSPVNGEDQAPAHLFTLGARVPWEMPALRFLLCFLDFVQ